MRQHLTLRHFVLAGTSLAVLAALGAAPGLLGHRVHQALADVGGASPMPLWAAGIGFVLTNVCAAMAWRVALGACRCRLSAVEAAARYCVGSGVNALVPLHAGSAVRMALFGTRVEGGAWTVGGVAAAVGAIRSVWLAVLVAIGCSAGVLPWWPLLALGGLIGASAVAGVVARRFRRSTRIGHVLAAFRELSRSPRELAQVAAWSLGGAMAKVGAAAAVASALGVGHPLRAGLVIIPAVELAAVLPLTPANVGVASAAVALALSAQGVGAQLGMTAGIAFGAVEWLAGAGVGAAGAVVLCRPRLNRWLVYGTTAAGAWALAWAFGVTVVGPAF